MYEKLLTDLYRSHDKRTSLAALAKVEGLRWLPFDKKANNRGTPGLASSPGQAVVELVTNELDAVIAEYEPVLDAGTNDVASALQQIPGPHVDVYVQGADKSSRKTVTVLDRGCGMTGDKMKESVLAIGCEDKPMNRNQHGSLGQGGATGLGISDGTLLASRLAGSNVITFTFVCERILESGLPSYSYATDANGDLFTAKVGSKLSLVNPDNIPNSSGVACALASWKPASEGGKGREDFLFPPHGTIRRMLSVSIQYHSGSKNTSEGLWTGLRDYLFATEGEIRLFGDRSALENGKWVYKENGVVKSGRNQLLGKGVGNQIAHKNSATLLLHEPYTSMNVTFREEDDTTSYWPLDIELMAYSSYHKELKGQEVPAAIVHDWLHASKSSEAPRGIMVTTSGQTHERMLSHHVFDKMPNLVGHVIIHVKLDNLPSRFLHKAIKTDREKLNSEFAGQVRHLLRDYVRNGPCSAELAKLNETLRPKAAPMDEKTLQAAMARATALLTNTLNGLSTGVLGTGALGAPLRKAVPPEEATHIGVIRKPRNDDDAANKGGKPNPFDPLLDRPTIIQMRKHTFVRGAEEFVTIRINAKDHLDKQVQLVLPAGFQFVAGCKPLRNGSKTYRVRCTKKATDGIFTAVFDYGDATACLMDRAMVHVVAKREKPVKEPLLIGTTPQVQMPKSQFVWIEGVEHRDYIQAFGNAGSTNFFNYQLQGDTLYVFLNTHYPLYRACLKNDIEKHGPAMVADWKQRFPMALLVSALLQTDEKGGLGPSGAVEGSHFERLERIAMGQLTTILDVYFDTAVRKTIAAGYREYQQQMAGD